MIKKLSALSVIFAAVPFMFAGCQTLPQSPTAHQQAAETAHATPSPPEGAGPAAAPPPPESVVGVARYYASRFNGRKTASGEIYDQKKMTAAHESLPFGTLVKVENLANSLSVVVKVNDRCRRHEDVFIDLSREAALELGFIRQGTAKVRITVVEHTPPGKRAATAQD